VLRERCGDHTYQYRGSGGVHHGRQRQQAGVQGMRQVQPQSRRGSAERQSGAQGIRQVVLLFQKKEKVLRRFTF